MIKIAIASYQIDPVKSAFCFRQNVINMAYTDAILKCGAIPVVIPYIDPKYAKEALNGFSGLLLPGGSDISPTLYGEENTFSKEPDLAYDLFELELLKAAEELNIMTLGICRGAQLINVYHHGSMHQDIANNTGSPIHKRIDKPYEGVHDVKLFDDSFLLPLFGTKTLSVNSLHHQGIKRLGDNLKPSAIATDGLIEAFEGTKTIAIQWHPEAMFDKMKPIFSYFIRKSQYEGYDDTQP